MKARRVRNSEFKEYNSKIVSADKAEREKDLKLDQFYLGFRPIVDTALIPLSNTRFIKGHKPSNHICARIKSHVYATECTIYHNTYHVKRYNKASTNVIYYNNDKSLVQSMRKRNTIYEKLSSEAEQGATGTSTGRRMPRSPRSPGSAERTPSRWQELSSSRVSQRKKRVE